MQGESRPPDVAHEREVAVAETLARVRRIIGTREDPPRRQLAQVGGLLAALAVRTSLFPDAHFPGVAGARHTV